MVEKTKPYKFESDDQLLYVATCIAASNLGFCIKDKTWQGMNAWVGHIKRRDSYASKADCVVQAVDSLSDEDCNLYQAILDERKGWVKHIKKDGFFNKDIEEYIQLAQEE